MIVKDESKVIERCLTSVKELIDYWVIVDTGSTDGTQQIIKECLKDVPGELHERKWVDFGFNRNEALALAKGKADYVLFIDADERLGFSGPLRKEQLEKDCYHIFVHGLDEGRPYQFQRAFLINDRLNWVWKGVLHEELSSSQAKSYDVLKEVVNFADTEDGHRSQDPKKYYKDAEVLEKALKEDPSNSRYVFYLALSYENAKDYALAIKNYEKRAAMGGWDQEIFWSLYSVGKIQSMLKMNSETIINSFCKAYQARRTRAEPLYQLANHFSKNQNYILGYSVAKIGVALPMPQDLIPVEHWIYEYGLLFEYANCAFALGKYEEAQDAYQSLLSKTNVPSDIQEKAKENLRASKWKLIEINLR